MDDKTLFWLAGLFEGEAHFGRGTPSQPMYPRVAVEMTDEDIVARVAMLFGHTYTPFLRQKNDWNTIYKFTLRGTPAALLMKQIYPLMGKRRQQQIDRALNGYAYNPQVRITNSKITSEQARIIKKRLAQGETAKSIAKDFPISHYAIWAISSGKTWGQVSVDSEEPPPIFPSVPLPTFSEENSFHWVTGLLEGEGSFLRGMSSESNRPRISVAMTDEDVIAYLAQVLNVQYKALASRNENHKNVYRVMIRGAKAVELMKQLSPFMGQRRQQQISKVLDSYVEIPHSRGMYNPSAKLSEGQARDIKRRLKDGESVQTLATDFNISESIVREIKLGRTWKHIIL